MFILKSHEHPDTALFWNKLPMIKKNCFAHFARKGTDKWYHEEEELSRRMKEHRPESYKSVETKVLMQYTPDVAKKWHKDNKVKVLEWSSQWTDLHHIKICRLKKRVRVRKPTN